MCITLHQSLMWVKENSLCTENYIEKQTYPTTSFFQLTFKQLV